MSSGLNSANWLDEVEEDEAVAEAETVVCEEALVMNAEEVIEDANGTDAEGARMDANVDTGCDESKGYELAIVVL